MLLLFENVVSGEELYIPLISTGTSNDNITFTVSWGDGSGTQTFTRNADVSNLLDSNIVKHTYTSAQANLTVSVTVTSVASGQGVAWNGINSGNGDRNRLSVGMYAKLVEVSSGQDAQWGLVNLTHLTGSFFKAVKLTKVPDAMPNTVISTAHAFRDAIIFNQNLAYTIPSGFSGAGYYGWDMSNVTTADNMFNNAKAFNNGNLQSTDINNWNVSKVKDMTSMFKDATVFNQPIGNWDVSSVTNMFEMFYDAEAFNQDITRWNTSKVTNMNSMFFNAGAFNQDIKTQLIAGSGQSYTAWDVSKVTNMNSMFGFTDVFNGDISQWNVGNVTDMGLMFFNAKVFNKDIGQWDVSKVTNMSYMFLNARIFNQDISAWDVSSVTDMSYMFFGATSFANNPAKWSSANPSRGINLLDTWGQPLHGANNNKRAKIANVLNFTKMFEDATSFDSRIIGWPINSSATLTDMIKNSGLSNNDSLGQGFKGLDTPALSLFGQNTCFNKGTQILCWKDNKEQYIAVEDLRKGMLVKTLDHGYKPIELMKCGLHTLGRLTDRGMYKMKKQGTMINDLEMTGFHAILVDENDSEYESDKLIQSKYFTSNKDKLPIDGKIRIRSMFCHNFEKMPQNEYTIYSFALDRDQYQYGIWANGVLVESTSHNVLEAMSNTNPNIQDVEDEI